MTVQFNSLSLNTLYIGIFFEGFKEKFQTVKPLENKKLNNFTFDIT